MVRQGATFNTGKVQVSMFNCSMSEYYQNCNLYVHVKDLIYCRNDKTRPFCLFMQNYQCTKIQCILVMYTAYSLLFIVTQRTQLQEKLTYNFEVKPNKKNI